MQSMQLRYGLNPAQSPACAEPTGPNGSPIRVVNGQPSYINLLDALNGWQLVREARAALGRPAAASFKHVSPAGAAVAGAIDPADAARYGLSDADISPITSAYLRARDADPKSSYGDFVALSDPVDTQLAQTIGGLVCDGIVAPGYAPEALERLRRKKNGNFLIIEAEPRFEPPQTESREVFGLTITQQRDPIVLEKSLLGPAADTLPAGVADDLLFGMIVLRYTQSNSVCYVRDGATLGIGAGQQSRVDCTRLAGQKVDTWWLRRHPVVRGLTFVPGVKRQDRINWQIRFVEGDLTVDERALLSSVLAEPAEPLSAAQRAEWLAELSGVSFVSDGSLPFRDNVDHARRHGVDYIAEPGGSIRSDEVAEAAAQHGVTIIRTGVRLFHH
jgi:phosphoribosylaminoimidazolecarboxamide formyltransferase/IMP cyclohydrolase